MGGKFRSKKRSAQKVVQPSRKQLRKEKRLEKKVKKNAYFQNRGKPIKPEIAQTNSNNNVRFTGSDKIKKSKALNHLAPTKDDISDDELDVRPPKVEDFLVEQKKEREKEAKLKIKLQKEMSTQRKKQLKVANRDEDRVIKKLEKQLKLNKRKSKSIPKSFVDEGLDYLLEVCDSEKLQGVAKTEMNLQESGSEFEDDFAIVTGAEKVKTKKKSKTNNNISGSDDDISETEDDDYSSSDDEISLKNKTSIMIESDQKKLKGKSIKDKNKSSMKAPEGIKRKKEINKDNESDSDDFEEDMEDNDFGEEEDMEANDFGEEEDMEDDDFEEDMEDGDFEEDTFSDKDIIREEENKETKKYVIKDKLNQLEKKVTFTKETKNSGTDLESKSNKEHKDNITSIKDRKRTISESSDEDETKKRKGTKKRKSKEEDSEEGSEDSPEEDNSDEKSGELWEDIYGRTRDKKGNIVQPTTGKYVPPHLRTKLATGDAKRTEELSRLRKQLKGLINRLAEHNMHGISSQIDEFYMKNSRNDMNETITELVFESLVAPTLTSERMVMEHVMLIAILHANVGMEVGAHFLQSVVKKFDEMYSPAQDVENKSLDNVVLIISHLYNFKVFNAVLMYNILEKLSETFAEKEVELILLVLRNVGFSLRKDDPLALKELILRLQKKANESSDLRSNTRVRFMLDILLAVKNNNMAKIPQYDPSYSEHLKKLIKTMIHKGKYLTELKITLEDLLKVEERGRWWIVGSAWTGNTNPTANVQNSVPVKTDEYSSVILELARKQRMNTDTRRNIFCILMSAEDYMDAFEKLLRLGLKSGQEQEIIHVLIHCLLQEKNFNPYYAHLASQLCITDRKHQLTIQYNVWDRLKELSDLGSAQITNLAKFLAHLFLEKSLPISVLKVVQFSEMDKACVKLMRQVLLTIVLHDCEETMVVVFTRVAKPSKLRMFRESLRLFLHHFILRNVKDESEEAVKLRERVKLAETALMSVDTSKLVL